MTSPVIALDFGQVQVQVLVAPLTEENFAVHLQQETVRIKEMLRSANNAPRKAVVVTHPSMTLPTTPTLRAMQAAWLKEHEHLLRLVCHAVGFVLPNPIVRFTMTAVLWLAPLPVPLTAHETLQSALDWAITESKQIGGDVSSDLVVGGVSAVDQRIAVWQRSRRV